MPDRHGTPPLHVDIRTPRAAPTDGRDGGTGVGADHIDTAVGAGPFRLDFVATQGPWLPHPSVDPPIVLLHGWASASSYWEPLTSQLVDAGHAVWIVDLPGYHAGDVLPADFEWTLATAADAVAAEIRQRTAAAHVVGHSLGGSVALTLAARHQECVATLALVGMVPAPPNEGFRTMLTSQLKQGFIDAATRDKCLNAWFGPLGEAERELLGQGFNVPFDVLGPSGLAAMEGVDPRDPGRVIAPTLVLVGTADRLRSAAQVNEFVAGSPLRSLDAVPDAGHSVHWEEPEACSAALGEFWQEKWPQQA